MPRKTYSPSAVLRLGLVIFMQDACFSGHMHPRCEHASKFQLPLDQDKITLGEYFAGEIQPYLRFRSYQQTMNSWGDNSQIYESMLVNWPTRGHGGM